jgi:hypothetical protein
MVVVRFVIVGLISIFDIWRSEARRLRRMLSRALVFKGVRLSGDHVDGSRLGLLSRRRARRRGGAALLGPALRVFPRSLELSTLLEAFLSSWRHRDGCVCRRELGSLSRLLKHPSHILCFGAWGLNYLPHDAQALATNTSIMLTARVRSRTCLPDECEGEECYAETAE